MAERRRPPARVILPAVALLLALMLPAWWVSRVMARYRQPENRYPWSGEQLARRLLQRTGISGVRVEPTAAGDHYDPTAHAVRLSPEHFRGHSLAAVAVAAHEVGHAIQDHAGYRPLRLRTRLIGAARGLERAAALMLVVSPFLGLVTRLPALSLLVFLGGAGGLLAAAGVHAVTLPTEFDASFGRALPLLRREAVLLPGDERHARRLLTAAALTYVAAALGSVLNVARWIAILRR